MKCCVKQFDETKRYGIEKLSRAMKLLAPQKGTPMQNNTFETGWPPCHKMLCGHKTLLHHQMAWAKQLTKQFSATKWCSATK